VPFGFLTTRSEERVERETGYASSRFQRLRPGRGLPSLNVTIEGRHAERPKERDINNRLTAASIEADVTLGSVWSGQPQITGTPDRGPVLNVPLAARAVCAIRPPRQRRARTMPTRSDHVIVTGGNGGVFNLRDRRRKPHRRHETPTYGVVRPQDKRSGNARTGEYPLKFDIQAAAPPPAVGAAKIIPTEFSIRSGRPVAGPVSGKAEFVSTGSVA